MLKELFFTKCKQAPELTNRIKNFLSAFQKKPPVPEEHGKIVRNFIDEILYLASQHKLWKGASEEEMEMANEALEKYVMTKIFNWYVATLCFRRFNFAPNDSLICCQLFLPVCGRFGER